MTENVVIAIITAAGSVIVAVFAAAAIILSKHNQTQSVVNETKDSVNDTHLAVNGRLQELLDVTKELARAQGIETGRERERKGK